MDRLPNVCPATRGLCKLINVKYAHCIKPCTASARWLPVGRGPMWAIMCLPAKYAHGIKSKAGSGWGRGQAGNYLPPQDVSSPSSVCICLCHHHNATQQYFEYCAVTTSLMHNNAQYSDMIMYFDVTASGYFMFWYSSIICSANSQWPDGYNLPLMWLLCYLLL